MRCAALGADVLQRTRCGQAHTTGGEVHITGAQTGTGVVATDKHVRAASVSANRESHADGTNGAIHAQPAVAGGDTPFALVSSARSSYGRGARYSIDAAAPVTDGRHMVLTPASTAACVVFTAPDSPAFDDAERRPLPRRSRRGLAGWPDIPGPAGSGHAVGVPTELVAPTPDEPGRRVASSPAGRVGNRRAARVDGPHVDYTSPASWTTMATCTRLVAWSLVNRRETWALTVASLMYRWAAMSALE